MGASVTGCEIEEYLEQMWAMITPGYVIPEKKKLCSENFGCPVCDNLRNNYELPKYLQNNEDNIQATEKVG